MAEGRFVRITSLLCGHTLVVYAFFVLQNYLTDVWGLSFTHAAAILNIWSGMCLILPGLCLYLVDQFLDHFRMLLLSSVSYSAGIMLVAMSTPPVLANSTGTCKQYEPNCIGHTQKVLFYIGMALIAVGMAGNKVSFRPLLQKNQSVEAASFLQILGSILVVLVAVTGAIALPYIRPWTIRFWIPAVCTVVGMFLFLSGYPYNRAPGADGRSPVTKVLKVFLISAKNICKPFPLDDAGYRQDAINPQPFRRTRFLRCLQKAAIRANPEEPNDSVSTVREVEDAKIAVRMIPMWLTFLVCGIVSSIGKTYFVEQADHLNRKIGRWNVPLQMLLLFSQGVGNLFERFADHFLWEQDEPVAAGTTQPAAGTEQSVIKKPREGNRPVVFVGLAMILSILCCITAARIEKKRIGVIRRHDLLDKPEDDIPMSVYWLLFQFFLLAGLDAFLKKSVVAFYATQAPESMKDYLNHFTSGVSGLGYMSSVLSVYVVGQISARRGRTNWFQFTLNKSRLDKYYWVLAGMSAVNFVVFVVVACFYRYKEANSYVENGEVAEAQNVGEDAPDGAS